MKHIPEMTVRDCFECPYHDWKINGVTGNVCNYGYQKRIEDPHRIPDWCRLEEVEL